MPNTIMLDRERTLVVNLNTHIDFEQATGQDFVHTIFSMAPTMDADGNIVQPGQIPAMQTFRALVWAALRQEDESLTLAQVGNMLTLPVLKDVSVILGEQLRLYFTPELVTAPARKTKRK